MSSQTSAVVFPSRTRRCSGFALGLLGLAILAGCGTTPPSVKHLQPETGEALTALSEHLENSSQLLTANQDRLNRNLNRPAPAKPPSLVAPAYDPLEDKLININMSDADVGMFLWALADQLGMNLIVEPEVLQLNKRANLSLKNVTAREVFDNILRAFDLSGKVTGTTLVVGLMDEQIFNVDFVNAHMTVDISTGGNVFGSEGSNTEGSGGGNQLQGNFSLSGGSGKENDPYEFLEKSVESILGQEKGQRGSAQSGEGEAKTAFSLNRVTGGLFVRGRPSQVRAVEEMIRYSRAVMTRQVQIEAQIIDVSLNDGFEYGVDWKLLRSQVAGTVGTSPLELGPATGTLPGDNALSRVLTIPQQLLGSATGNSAGLGYFDDSFSVALTALRSFGDLNVLSNPSVRVRNGAPAMLSVGTSVRYVSKISSTLTNPGGGASTTSSDVQTDSLFAGVVFGVIPRIDKDGRVELLIHPMQTDVEPASLALTDVGNGNRVTLPVINYKGMTTTLNLADGDTVLIGGLIDQRVSNNNGGIPFLSDIPGLGLLFDQQNDSKGSRELVVVLRATVL
jgi:general secretion pathway protein D